MNNSEVTDRVKIIKEAIRIEENALSSTNSHKKKMEIYKTIEFLNWRLAQIGIEERKKNARA
jgi:hypothetical protein